MQLVAQENLDALIKKCETIESIDINVVRTRNSQTKELETKAVTITIKENPALINEFLAAFKKDEINATMVTEDRKGGRINKLFYQFKNNVSYTFHAGEKDILARFQEREGYATIYVVR
jgi:glycine cleavage system regulatory protein